MIQIKNLTKKIDGNVILKDLNLDIQEGSAFGLLGSNGAGKSTLLRLLSGIYRQETGEIFVDEDTVYDNPETKRKIFFINDETVQFQKYTLTELKNIYSSFYPNYSEEIFEKLNGVINLPLDKKLTTFSKGMKRQAIVMVALACQPEYLLLDEAFDGLDPTMRIIVKKMIVDAMVENNFTVIISSHNLNEMNELCDTVALLHKGKIVFSRELDSIKGDVHKVQLAFAEGKDITQSDITNAGIEVLHFEKKQSIYNIIAKGENSELSSKFAILEPVVCDIVPLTLEEIFIYEMEALGYDYNTIK